MFFNQAGYDRAVQLAEEILIRNPLDQTGLTIRLKGSLARDDKKEQVEEVLKKTQEVMQEITDENVLGNLERAIDEVQTNLKGRSEVRSEEDALESFVKIHEARLKKLQSHPVYAWVDDIDGNIDREGIVPDEIVQEYLYDFREGRIRWVATGRVEKLAPDHLPGMHDLDAFASVLVKKAADYERSQQRGGTSPLSKLPNLRFVPENGGYIYWYEWKQNGLLQRKEIDLVEYFNLVPKGFNLDHEATYAGLLRHLEENGFPEAFKHLEKKRYGFAGWVNDAKYAETSEAASQMAALINQYLEKHSEYRIFDAVATSIAVDIVLKGQSKKLVIDYLKRIYNLEDREIIMSGDKGGVAGNDYLATNRPGGLISSYDFDAGSRHQVVLPFITPKGVQGVDARLWVRKQLDLGPIADREQVSSEVRTSYHRAQTSRIFEEGVLAYPLSQQIQRELDNSLAASGHGQTQGLLDKLRQQFQVPLVYAALAKPTPTSFVEAFAASQEPVQRTDERPATIQDAGLFVYGKYWQNQLISDRKTLGLFLQGLSAQESSSAQYVFVGDRNAFIESARAELSNKRSGFYGAARFEVMTALRRIAKGELIAFVTAEELPAFVANEQTKRGVMILRSEDAVDADFFIRGATHLLLKSAEVPHLKDRRVLLSSIGFDGIHAAKLTHQVADPKEQNQILAPKLGTLFSRAEFRFTGREFEMTSASAYIQSKLEAGLYTLRSA